MDNQSENQPIQQNAGISPQELNKLNKMDKQQLLAQAIQLTKDKRRLITRLKEFQPQKQKLLRNPNMKKLDKLFKECQMRKYAFKICYIGTSYDGMAIQQDTENTIQQYIFKVLYTLSLIPQKMPGASYTRSGRTDKGVSAMGNVISLLIRTNIKKTQENRIQQKQHQSQQIEDNNNKQQKQQNTLNYCQMMNALLPQDIRVLAASQVDPEFNSRYWCIRRSYKYFFPKNNLNIQLMKKSIKNFQGKHNFLNYCKMNLTNTVNFQRTIMKAQIHKAINNEIFEQIDDRNQIYYLYFVGNSFLWHQIRFMANIMFMVGSGQEQPSIINDLFDLNKFPCKPNYAMAPEYPLILQNCQYDKVTFTPDPDVTLDFYNSFHEMVKKKSIQKTLLLNCMMMARRQLMETAQLNHRHFVASVKQLQEKSNRKRKSLAIHKPSAKSLQEAVKGLKGKKLDMFEKKMKKQQQYQQKTKKAKQAKQAKQANQAQGQ